MVECRAIPFVLESHKYRSNPKRHRTKNYERLETHSIALYKLLSNVVMNRLKEVLHKCIADSQSAFVSCRSILDNALVAIELVVHYMDTKKRGNEKSVALKLDISKAYAVLIGSNSEMPCANGVL